jgi:hypothetical protein
MIGIVSISLNLLNKVNDGDHDKFHMYDTIPAYILIAFKLLILIVFLIGCIKNILKDNNQRNLQVFMFKFMIQGCFYLSFLPFVILIADSFSLSSRK